VVVEGNRGSVMKATVSLRAWCALLALSLACVACGPPWELVAVAVPNPFANNKSFAVEPVRYEGLLIGEKTEAEYLSGKDDGQRESFGEDKSTFARAFADQLAEELPEVRFVAAPGPSPFLVRPHVTFIEPGFYAYVAARPTEVEMTLEIMATTGQMLDVVKFRATVGATMTNPSSGGRLRAAGEILGGNVAEYMRTRVMP
jgi:hypothetical protein